MDVSREPDSECSPAARDWYSIAQKPALGPHLAPPAGCAAPRTSFSHLCAFSHPERCATLRISPLCRDAIHTEPAPQQVQYTSTFPR